jgi:hypothetical protein
MGKTVQNLSSQVDKKNGLCTKVDNLTGNDDGYPD